jgi:SAM-dependent methyltransferase
MSWKAYNELAWTERFLAPPEKYEGEVRLCLDALGPVDGEGLPSLLHLGCGAGGYDYHLKKQFSVTGADVSEGMLELARKLNPEVRYVHGDMRTVRLPRRFDAVIIPDSIMYMRSLPDVKAVLRCAVSHLRPGGRILAVTVVREEYRDNCFSYSGRSGDVEVTLFEENRRCAEDAYEAVLVYLIRKRGVLEIAHEVHTLGLFSAAEWEAVSAELGLEVESFSDAGLYDSYLLSDGEYRQRFFTWEPGADVHRKR